ncbi:hypothetical protein O3M35_008364 [Rhynocoris fuscipes]|uniref:C2H2-type domain-containing protein n=1 Tax=Rhynocoris fuscipes TaxID=488301 RepID=A0AAW1D6N4_9HEMI
MNFEGSVGSELLKVVDSDEDEDLIVDGSDTESEISVSDVGDMATSSGAGHYELHCMVCGLPRSHTVEANFLHIDNTFPLTLVSKTPVLLKLIDIIPSDMQPKLNIGDNLICRRCFNLIDSADILELRLTSVKKELYDFVSRVHRSKSSVVEVTQRNVAGYTPHNGWEGAAYNPDVLGGTLQSLQLVEYAKHLNGCTSKCRVPDSVPMTNRISSKDGPSSLEDKRLPYSPSSVQFSPLKLPYLPLLSPNSSSLYPSSSFWQGVGYITTELFSPPVNESVENVVTSSSIQNDKKEIENELPKEHKNESVEENSEAVNFPVRTAEKETKKVLSISSSSVDNIKRCRGSFQCDRCGRTFSQKPRLMNHLKKHSDDFTFKCQYCSKGYTVELNLMLHLRSHKDKRPYLCNRCPASFLKTEDLQSHLLFCLDKTFPCTKCIKMFASSEKLEMHVSTHHMKDNNEPPIKKHECKVCEKRFRYAAELQNHLLSHDNNKSFHCDICNRAYKHKRHLNRHYRDSHTNQSSKETKSHRKLENSIVCEKNSEKKSICPICKKAVRRINVHMISHSNVKGFSCGKCNAEFTLKHSLVRHIQRKHSNENLPDKKS